MLTHLEPYIFGPFFFSCCFDNSFMAVGTEDLPIDKELSLGLRKRMLVDKLSNYKLFQENCFLLF